MSKTYICRPTGHGIKVYHTDENCPAVTESPTVREMEREHMFEQYDVRLCRHCNGEKTGGQLGEQDHSYQQALKQAAEDYDSPEAFK